MIERTTKKVSTCIEQIEGEHRRKKDSVAKEVKEEGNKLPPQEGRLEKRVFLIAWSLRWKVHL